MAGDDGRNGELDIDVEGDTGDDGDGGDDDDDARAGPAAAKTGEGEISGVGIEGGATELLIVLNKSCTGVG